jgi:hypothetical protein
MSTLRLGCSALIKLLAAHGLYGLVGTHRFLFGAEVVAGRQHGCEAGADEVGRDSRRSPCHSLYVGVPGGL